MHQNSTSESSSDSQTLTEASTACAWRMAAIGIEDAGAWGLGGGGGGVALGVGGGGGGGGAAATFGAGAGADWTGFGGSGAFAGAAAGFPLTGPGLILNRSWPAFTVSPSLTKISSITPLTGVGTPTVVLSVSISITFWSTWTSSPTLHVNLKMTIENAVLRMRKKHFTNYLTSPSDTESANGGTFITSKTVKDRWKDLELFRQLDDVKYL